MTPQKLGFFVLALVFALAPSETTASARPRTTPKPAVTRIVVKKEAHTMDLFAGDDVVAHYAVAIGPGGAGPKHREGDKITPVGRYHIVQRGPSEFRVFMLLDYPNKEDWKRFKKWKAEGRLSKEATIGSAIGIHGAPASKEWKAVHKSYDWTLGCVAVNDDEIEAIAKRVVDGTIVDIED